MRLFHFSDDPAIEHFVPRPVSVASDRPPGREWLNGPLVWAIDDAHAFMYLFPRDCPRILIWAKPDSRHEERREWLGDRRAAAYIERDWHDRLKAGVIHRYELPVEGFEDLGDAGMWVSRQSVFPIALSTLSALDGALALQGVELRIVDSLAPLKGLWRTSLHASGIRLRNARTWK